LAHLAYEIHSAHASAVVTEREVEEMISPFLTDQGGLGLGLSQSEARSYLPQFSRVAEGTLGVLVRQREPQSKRSLRRNA